MSELVRKKRGIRTAFAVASLGALLSVAVAADPESSPRKLNEADRELVSVAHARLVKMGELASIPDSIFREQDDVYVALKFQISADGHASHVAVHATNLDLARDAAFLKECMLALARSTFSRRPAESQLENAEAMILMRFKNPWKKAN